MPDNSHSLVRRLETELAYIPSRMRKPHLQRMAKLITELLPGQLYRYGRIFHNIVRFQPDADGDRLLSGDRLRRDLGLG